MRHIFLLSLLFTSLACVTSGTISEPVTSDVKVTNYETYHVTAEQALHLRTNPEELGGTVIAVMPNGAEFSVKECMYVASSKSWWVYGTYTTPDGTELTGWASYRYVSGGCE